MRTIFSIFLLIGFFISPSHSQKIPSQWRITDDGRFLVAGDQASTGIYDENIVEEIRLTFPQSNYWSLMTQNYSSKTDLPATIKYKNETLDSVGVRFKGQTSYFANNSQKKSFNISIDAFRDDQRLEGYKTLNLNNAFQDPSMMREVLYYNLIRQHSPAAKANFVKLYINDEYWGIYLSIQQLNKDFLEEWYETNDGNNFRADLPDGSSPGGGGGGQWGDGTAAINYLGSDTLLYQKYYNLKSSGYKNPWTELLHACDVLNNSGTDLENVISEVFDIDKILWHLACEIAFVDDDSYVYKGKMDYYIYQDEISGRWATFDYDANSVMATEQGRINWSPFYNENKVNYPLLNKVLKIPAFRQRYLAHMRTILETSFAETYVSSLIDQYDALIREHVLADTKKTTSNQAYINGLTTLKNFIRNRKNVLLANTEINKVKPVIEEAKYTSQNQDFGEVTDADEVLITTKASHDAGIKEVNVFVTTSFNGIYQSIAMNDAGSNGDEIAGDGIYSLVLPAFAEGTTVLFYIEAVANDNAQTVAYFPAGAEHEVFIIKVVRPEHTADKISINEFMASNGGIITDDNGDADDWIELFNLTNEDIDMTGYYISDKSDNPTKFIFEAGTIIPANGFLIVWADENKSQGPLHANFKLSAGGEEIILSDNDQNVLDHVVFGEQTEDKSSARIPNGTGDFQIVDHTFNKNNDITLDSENVELTSALSVYPNPSSDVIYFHNKSNANMNVMLFDVSGRIMQNISVSSLEIVPLTGIKPGIYFVKQGAFTCKLIKI